MNFRTNRTYRSGIVLLTILVVLGVSMIVLGLVAQSLTSTHRQNRLRHDQRQCRRLAEAGAERGRILAAGDENYTGETWNIAAGDLHRRHAAAVEITVEAGVAKATSAWPADAPKIRHTTASDSLPEANND